MMKRALLAFAMFSGAACATTGGSPSTVESGGGSQPGATGRVWPVLTREHVDLWLHGYAMLLRDTSRVPVFRRGYRERLEDVKRQRNVSTQLDANRARLQERFALSAGLVNGQFLPLYFANFDQMKQMIDLFIRAEGNPNAASDPAVRQFLIVLASSFGNAGDREWLRLFTQAVDDERRQYYADYWRAENGARLAHVRAADSLWQGTYRARFSRFLNNTQQENGDFILALTLGGEGRTVNFSSRQNAVAATMPESDPREAIYVLAHEITNGIVSTAVNDNITPTEQRSGAGARLVLTGTVRAGAMLIQRVAPELLAGYTRYYLAQAGMSTTGDINARLVSAFPLPDNIREAIDRQLEVVLGGI